VITARERLLRFNSSKDIEAVRHPRSPATLSQSRKENAIRVNNPKG
jgi:hypothetical protein